MALCLTEPTVNPRKPNPTKYIGNRSVTDLRDPAQPGSKTVRTAIARLCTGFFIVCVIAAQLSARDGFRHVGKWSNVQLSKGQETHASGFELTLWEYNGQLLGYLSRYVGPTHDPPIGRLTDIILDKQTGRISFRAKMSLGMQYAADEKKWVPTRDLYAFHGKYTPEEISGVFEKKAVGNSGSRTNTEKVTLTGGESSYEFWDQMTYEEWTAFYEPIVKVRGPQW